MHPFDPAYNNRGTIIDQAFQNGSAPPAEDMMAAQPMPMPMPMPMNSQNQMVPNVMMDMPEGNFQQQNANAAYMNAQQMQTGYPIATEQQTGTYDLNVPPFDIEDPLLRRQFFRKVFTILLLQKLCAIPVIGLFLLCTSEPMDHRISGPFWLFGFLIFIAMYVFSDYRRHPPVNYLSLVFTTLFVGVQAGIYATQVGGLVAITSQVSLAGQLFLMMAFTKQSRIKFTNLNGIFVSLFIYLVFSAIIIIVAPHVPSGIELWIAFIVIYSIYDMQLQLSGHHGYNLKAEEYIFSAVNIHADIPNLMWRLFRYIFVDHFVRIWQFFKKCCFAEVC